MGQIRATVGALYRRLREGLGAPVRDGEGEEAVESGRSATDANGPDGETTAEMLAPRAYASSTELVKETGVTPRKYLRAVLDAHEGRLSQKEICEYTGWPSSTVSCLLGQMDDRGDVVRIRLGREKFVFLPDAVPEVRKTERERSGGAAFRPDEGEGS